MMSANALWQWINRKILSSAHGKPSWASFLIINTDQLMVASSDPCQVLGRSFEFTWLSLAHPPALFQGIWSSKIDGQVGASCQRCLLGIPSPITFILFDCICIIQEQAAPGQVLARILWFDTCHPIRQIRYSMQGYHPANIICHKTHGKNDSPHILRVLY